MKYSLLTRKAFVLLVPALLAASASAVSAQDRERELLSWSGTVDREILITMHGRDAWLRSAGGSESAGRRQVRNALPRQAGYVEVRVEDGRGEVEVIQQPSPRNDYTTILRIRDRQSGADRYRISAYWTPQNLAWGRERAQARRVRSNARGVAYWRGSVDDVVEIRLQGERLHYRRLSGQTLRDVQTDISRFTLPREPGQLRVETMQGRGSVRVVQQPSARNGYTAIIEIRDPQSGYGHYDFRLSWARR